MSSKLSAPSLLVIGLLVLAGAGVVRYLDYRADVDAAQRKAAAEAKAAEEARAQAAEEKKLAAWRSWYQPPAHCEGDVAEANFVACVNHKMEAKKAFEAQWQPDAVP